MTEWRAIRHVDPSGASCRTRYGEGFSERAPETRPMKPAFDVPGHFYILLTLAFTVYGQLVLRWQMGGAGPLPPGGADKLIFLIRQFANPWIVSGFVAAFVASLAWMAAMTRFELGYAYPFMSLAFVIVMLFGVVFLGESVNLAKVAGTLLVVAGLVVIARA
jgi:multidrug transporter EmrE-like cation transporter